MIVVMKVGSNQRQVEHVIKLVREMGLKEHVIVGTERTVVAVIGDDRMKDRSVLETVDGVDKVVPILAPYKMASREVIVVQSTVMLIIIFVIGVNLIVDLLYGVLDPRVRATR